MRIPMRFKLALTVTVATLATAAAAGSSARAATVPVKEIETSHFGWEVDQTTKGKICTVESKDVCGRGQKSSEPGGFEYSESLAGAGGGSGNIYVLDGNNHRVQELEHDGKFVLMFGSKVNKKGGDLCTAAEEGECRAGVEGTTPGQFAEQPWSIAVDPTSGDVYVAEYLFGGGKRVQEFTATGVFVLEIGREVNETKDKEAGATGAEKDLCSEEEVIKSGVKCTVPVAGASPEPGAFNFRRGPNLLAVGGPEDLLYVGDEHRVQAFHAETGPGDGHYKSEIPLTSISSEPGLTVANLALDATTGNVYVVYGDESLVREFDPAGTEIKDIPTGFVLAVAVDSKGLLAVSEDAGGGAYRGSLYEVGAGLHLVSLFPGNQSSDIAFNGKDELYAAIGGETLSGLAQEVISYSPVPIGALLTIPTPCVAGAVSGTDATFACTLDGEVDPWGVSETMVWFGWGRTPSLENKTEPPISVPNLLSEGKEELPLVKVSAPIAGLRPNEAFYEGLVGEDHNVKAPESITSATTSFTTPSVPPRIVGAPIVAFVSPFSAVMFGSVNPENTLTSYEFQYAPLSGCEGLGGSCAGRLEASVLSSPEYGVVGVSQEVTGLQPSTPYRYRLAAVNAKSEIAVNETGGPELPEGTFETAPAPAVVAQTGGASLIGTTSAVVSGSVNPDGQPSTYTFEMGVYNSAGTHYGVVFSAPAGAGSEPVQEELGLSGLQPGTTYAYRIAIHFGEGIVSGSSATGATATFTTAGLPAVLFSPAPLAMLAIPNIAFPAEAKVSTVKALTNAQKLAKALKACKKDKSKKQRAACQKQARKKYPKSKQANNRKKG